MLYRSFSTSVMNMTTPDLLAASSAFFAARLRILASSVAHQVLEKMSNLEQIIGLRLQIPNLRITRV
jgi:hypothetical protein